MKGINKIVGKCSKAWLFIGNETGWMPNTLLSLIGSHLSFLDDAKQSLKQISVTTQTPTRQNLIIAGPFFFNLLFNGPG